MESSLTYLPDLSPAIETLLLSFALSLEFAPILTQLTQLKHFTIDSKGTNGDRSPPSDLLVATPVNAQSTMSTQSSIT